ncbi:hypothetical protein BGZ57DRAFT_119934 [Hyaloscypha finlandica]|nr:hypothetical protein BGZ57DRAFT_119934 [Hyaloscypha finlandica]
MSVSKYQELESDENSSRYEDDSSSEKSLLGVEDGSPQPIYPKHTFWDHPKITLLLHGAFLALNIVSMVFIFLRPSKDGLPSLVYSPIESVVSYETRNFTNDDIPMYMGPPSHEREKNWHDLLQGIDVRVTGEDLERLGRKENAVGLEDERGGYVVLVNAYHELHCIKLIRQTLYADHFYPNETEADAAERLHHIDHCLNYLRQAAQCHGDIGLSTWHWEDNNPMPMGHTLPHVCKSWDKIDIWAKERKVNLYQIGLLVHPELGPPFPYGVLKDNPPSDGGP